MKPEPYRASIHVDAEPSAVFRYFVEPTALTRWMGDTAVIDPRPGGEFTLVFADRVVEGQYLEVLPPNKVVISWGRRGSREFPPGASILEVTLTVEGDGTRVSIVHSGLPRPELQRHALGWDHYLARLEIAAAGGDPGTHLVPQSLLEGVD